jgi:8-oxo-dGTP pyrophosphatase MutT (NUDIX family)
MTRDKKSAKSPKKPDKKAGKAKIPPLRLQYAALPWRRSGTHLEFMLLSSRETKRWIIPKGWPMSGRSGAAAAAIEALEEAGLLGVISGRPIGHYTYAKRFSAGVEEPCRVEVYDLRVTRQRETWLEKDQRNTQWFPAEEAISLVSDPELGDVIGRFILAMRM